MIKKRPLTICSQLILSILDDYKTMTRRVVKHQIKHCRLSGSSEPEDVMFVGKNLMPIAREYWKDYCPYGVKGDRLWVRETWRISGMKEVVYKASSEDDERNFQRISCWESPVTMPRWASRISLEITDIRVERLGDISEEDCRREGVTLIKDCRYRHDFMLIWNSLAKPGEKFKDNPWVWVVSFRRLVS